LTSVSNIDEITIDSTLCDVYWTTTMEWQSESKEDVKDIISWKWWKDNLFVEEVLGIKKWFDFIRTKIIVPLDIETIKSIHFVATKWLDNVKWKEWWLDYSSWILRNNELVDMWIFKQKWMDWKAPFYPPENPEYFIQNLLDAINAWEFTLLKLWLFHIIFYWYFFS
jgi:hypothetical protein